MSPTRKNDGLAALDIAMKGQPTPIVDPGGETTASSPELHARHLSRRVSGARRTRWPEAIDGPAVVPVFWLVVSVTAVVALTAIMLAFREQLGILNILLLYLLLTFFLALNGGLWPAIVSAVLGFLAFDFFFIPPYLTLTVAAPDHVLALFVYLGVAIITARLVSGMRERTEQARRESHRMAMLAELNAALIGDVTLSAILERIAESVVTVYGAKGCRVLVLDDGFLRTGAYFPARIGPEINRTGLSLAEWSIEHRQPVGRSSRPRRIVPPRRIQRAPMSFDNEPRRHDVLYLPIVTANRTVGAVEVIGRPNAGPFRPGDEQFLMTFVDQAALALERARLSDEAAQAEVLAQSDELKSALLAAVSHDLRTPLASIKAAATSLLDESVAWDADTRHDFLTAIDEETDRLSLMVGNLLDLSRIEGGALRPQKDWYDVDELVADVTTRLASRTADHPLTATLQDDLPSLRFDYIEIAQVLTNLIENAVKYTPSGTPIAVAARQVPGAIELSVHDGGPGIPPETQRRLFEKFYRAYTTASVPGTGIGLAIARGLVEAHGGQISVESSPEAGTTFRFTLPLLSPAEEDARVASSTEAVAAAGRAA